MQMRSSPSVRVLDTEWHRQRQRAREVAFNSSLEMFSEAEIIKYDLATAQIDGSDNPLVYKWNRPLDLFGINGTDVRELDTR